MTLTRNSKRWLLATVLISCLFMLSASFYAWGSTDGIPILASGRIIYDAPISNATLRFKSGFESPISITHSGDGQQSYLHGADQGYDWDDVDHMFNYVALYAFSTHIYTDLVTTRNKSGSRSLYTKVIDPYGYPTSAQWAREQLNIYMDDGAGEYSRSESGSGATVMPYMSRYYISYWVFIPSTYDLPAPGWDMLFENYEWADPSLSTGIFIYRTSDFPDLYWYTRGKPYGTETTYWEAFNREVAVPKNLWFKLEIYVERHQTNGVVVVWIDGVKIFNLLNIKTTNGVSEHWSAICKMYGGYGSIYPVERWYDDLEIWDAMPTAPPSDQPPT